jgi:hypothetical protein
MKLLWTPITLATALAVAGTAAAQNLPTAGLWELSMTMQGAPGGGNTRSGKACLSADALAAAPERTLFEAAGKAAASGDRAPPKCTFAGVQRDGANTSWQSQCEGPMGTMQGKGNGMLGAESAELQQAFTAKASMGTLNLKQTLSARRVGSC